MDEVTVHSDSGRSFEVGVVQQEYAMGHGGGKVLVAPVYDERYLAVLADSLMNRPRHEFDTIVMATGERRTGKTTLCAQLARTVDSEFSVGHMTFRVADFNKVLADNPYADPANNVWPQVVLDEAGFDLFSQNWMEKVQRNMVKKFEVIGIKKQIVYLVLPHRDMLNKKLREGMAQFWLNTQTIHGKRGFVEVRRGVPNKWHLDRYWAPECAFLFEPLDGLPWWDDYVTKKRTFVDEVANEVPDIVQSELKDEIRRRAQSRYRTTDLTHAQLAADMGIPKSTISDWCKGMPKIVKHLRE